MQTLTSAEPGWYLCSFAVDPREERVRYWNGKQLCIDNSIPHRPVSCKAAMVNFERLYTEAEVAELRTALAAAECLVGEADRGAIQVNAELEQLHDQLTTCDHENSDLASKLKSMESQNAELRRQVDELGRKWKCVLDNACIEWSEYEPRHWVIDIDCDKSIPLHSISDRQTEAFDAAVTKSMESPNG